MTEEDAKLDTFNKVSSAIAHAVRQSMQEIRRDTSQMFGIDDTTMIACVINGAVAGVMEFISDMADEGTLSDPDEKVTLMFKLAAGVWTQIRGGPAGPESTIQ